MPIALILLILGWNYLIDRDLKSDRAEVAPARRSGIVSAAVARETAVLASRFDPDTGRATDALRGKAPRKDVGNEY